MLARLWEAFRRWRWAKRIALLLIAPWLVLLAWMVTTARPRRSTAGAVSLVALLWLSAVAGAANAGTGDVGTGRSGTESDQTTTTTAESSTTTAPDPEATTTTEAPATTTPTTEARRALTVVHITDGDTLDLSDGRTVRLAQVDAPEANQCFGSESAAALATLADSKIVELRRPADAPQTDQYGRTLAEVIVEGRSVNAALIRQGAAEFYEEFALEDDDLAGRLQAAEHEAQAAGRGLWSACAAPPTTALPPLLPTSPPPTVAPLPPPSSGNCDPAYPDVCVPSLPPDLNCGDISYRRFRVVAYPDPHGFDGDNDGVGCESG